MLQKLVGKLKPNPNEGSILIIKDSATIPDFSLLYSMFFNKAALYKSSHVILFEHTEEDFFKVNKGIIPYQVTVHECYHYQYMTKLQLQVKLQRIFCSFPAEEIIICFDSLNPWIQVASASSVIQTLCQLQNLPCSIEILAVIHTDLISESVNLQFSKIVGTTLCMDKKPSLDLDTSKLVCNGKSLKPSGKILFFIESFLVSTDFKLETKTCLSQSTTQISQQNEKNVASPPCIATFDISTKQEEILQKNLLVLPYTKMNESGSIIYEADYDDDLDYDDPDEDLEF
uniref:Elongator complex protein 5 n=1 Tax=Phallusia mammillata TaxID=59560 RepID=A0A6F9DBS6_9ASCI|nr:elongator complex protein 5-like [Phallusia mammillata]